MSSKDTDIAIMLVAGTLDNSFRTKFHDVPEICSYGYPQFIASKLVPPL
jgi:hypothetical protein